MFNIFISSESYIIKPSPLQCRNIDPVIIMLLIIPLVSANYCLNSQFPCGAGKSNGRGSFNRYCLCNINFYCNKYDFCETLESLTLTDIIVTRVTSTSVQFSWSDRMVAKQTAMYLVKYIDEVVQGNAYGITISRLQPNTKYDFYIFVKLPREQNYYEEKYGPNTLFTVQTLAEVSTVATTSSHRPNTFSTLNTTTASLGTTAIQTTSDSISFNIFLPVTLSLCLLLTAAIIIITLMGRRLKSQKRATDNSYDTRTKGDQDTHLYCVATNQGIYEEVTNLSLNHYTNC
uniref:Fibronectin type-III domain-containing protein n=1 Tax=Biomphalaria glabrata TaxID=6526 RepID=A0A2C9LCV5_BIOGL